jgi:tRNA(adenine34) deaminase
VVYGADDPKAGAVGSLWDVVRDRRLNHRPEVIGGVRAEESATLLRAFFRAQRGL